MSSLLNQTWYAGSTKWSAVTAWAASASITAGALRRQSATPATGSERVFIALNSGTTGGTEPTWGTTEGAKTTDNTITWQDVTGKAAVNGDAASTSDWTSAKNTAVSLGLVIKNVAGTHYFIASTAGTAGNGSEPSWNTTTGATTSDGTVTWTCIGAVGSFSIWGAPAARLNVFMATGFFSSAGDRILVNSSHAETQASAISYNATASGTAVRRTSFICVDDAGALSTGASISTTGANAITLGTFYYLYGITLNAGSGANAATITLGSSTANTFENCTFNRVSTTASNILIGGGSGGDNEFRNCTFVFAASGDQMSFGLGRVRMFGGSIAATGTAPTTLFTNGGAGTFRLRGVNLSGVTGNLVSVGSTPADLFLENCRLGSGVTKVPTGTNTPQALRLHVHNSNSGAVNYDYYHQTALGLAQAETSVVRTGGASDGTTPLSWLLTSSANASLYQPFVSDEIVSWNDATGSSKTATVELTTDASLTNAECWLEIEYPSSASYPLGLTVTTRAALLATPSTLTTSSATWGGTAKTNKYKLSASFTPQMKGPVKARVYLAKASTTVYVDPVVTVA